MKRWLKRKLRQFLCVHKKARLVQQVSTLLYTRAEADPLAADGFSETVLYFKKTFDCDSCGKRNIHVIYRR